MRRPYEPSTCRRQTFPAHGIEVKMTPVRALDIALGEWRAGRHLNLGPGPEAAKPAFWHGRKDRSTDEHHRVLPLLVRVYGLAALPTSWIADAVGCDDDQRVRQAARPATCG
jgi:hypothetical protein